MWLLLQKQNKLCDRTNWRVKKLPATAKTIAPLQGEDRLTVGELRTWGSTEFYGPSVRRECALLSEVD